MASCIVSVSCFRGGLGQFKQVWLLLCVFGHRLQTQLETPHVVQWVWIKILTRNDHIFLLLTTSTKCYNY